MVVLTLWQMIPGPYANAPVLARGLRAAYSPAFSAARGSGPKRLGPAVPGSDRMAR